MKSPNVCVDRGKWVLCRIMMSKEEVGVHTLSQMHRLTVRECVCMYAIIAAAFPQSDSSSSPPPTHCHQELAPIFPSLSLPAWTFASISSTICITQRVWAEEDGGKGRERERVWSLMQLFHLFHIMQRGCKMNVTGGIMMIMGREKRRKWKQTWNGLISLFLW